MSDHTVFLDEGLALLESGVDRVDLAAIPPS